MTEKSSLTKSELLDFINKGPAIIYKCSINESGDFIPSLVSDNFSTRLGYSPDEFLNSPHFWFENIHPEDQKYVPSLQEELYFPMKFHHQL